MGTPKVPFRVPPTVPACRTLPTVTGERDIPLDGSPIGGPSDASEAAARVIPTRAAGRSVPALRHPTGKRLRGAVTSCKRPNFLNHRPPTPLPDRGGER